MSEKQDEQVQWAVRLPESFLERADKLAERMSEPAMKITRTDVLRMAMFRGIEQLETEKKKR
jgi:hypothetical protein